MNKKLLAMAVGATIVLPGAAFADGPKVYGKINVSLESYEPQIGVLDDLLDSDPGFDPVNDADDKLVYDNETQDRWQLDSNASRLGVKGDFDLDVAGLKAIYKLEYEVAVDDGDDVFKQRNIYGGLEGGFGTVMAGKFDTPLKKAQGKIDQFGDLDADIKVLLRGETRADNIIQYSSPKLADMVTLNVAVMPAENDDLNGGLDNKDEGDNGIADKTSISAVFEQGGLYAAVAMDKNNDDKDLLIDEITGSPLDITRVVAAYKADAFELGALYQVAEEADKDETVVPASKAGEETSMVLSGAFKLDRWKFKAQYGVTEGSESNALNPTLSDPEITLTAIGADYKLAKASKLYIYMADLEVDYGDSSDPFNTEEDSTMGFGFEHKF